MDTHFLILRIIQRLLVNFSFLALEVTRRSRGKGLLVRNGMKEGNTVRWTVIKSLVVEALAEKGEGYTTVFDQKRREK